MLPLCPDLTVGAKRQEFFGIYGFLLVFGFVLMALAGHFKVWNWGRFKYDEGYNDVPLAIIGAIPLGIAFLHMIGLF